MMGAGKPLSVTVPCSTVWLRSTSRRSCDMPFLPACSFLSVSFFDPAHAGRASTASCAHDVWRDDDLLTAKQIDDAESSAWMASRAPAFPVSGTMRPLCGYDSQALHDLDQPLSPAGGCERPVAGDVRRCLHRIIQRLAAASGQSSRNALPQKRHRVVVRDRSIGHHVQQSGVDALDDVEPVEQILVLSPASAAPDRASGRADAIGRRRLARDRTARARAARRRWDTARLAAPRPARSAPRRRCRRS